jgi:Ca2+-binding RTX toxin-like protein
LQSDNLVGGDGADTLNGAGNGSSGAGEIDRLVGGNGADIFVLGITGTSYYTAGGDYAGIADFVDGVDTIQLTNLGSGSADYGLFLNAAGTFTQIRIAATNEVIGLVRGITPADLDLTTADFVFV